MPFAKKTTTTAPLPAKYVRTQVEGRALLSPLDAAVRALSVNTPEDYSQADLLLGDIRRSRKIWDDKMEPIRKPLREAKSAADALFREIDRPLEECESHIKGMMRAFKLKEAKALAEEQTRIREERERVARELEAAAEKEQSAVTAKMRDRLRLRRESLEQQADVLDAEDAPVAVQGTSSLVRRISQWDVEDLMSVVKAVAAGAVPLDVLMLNRPFIAETFRKTPQTVAGWAGFNTYEDVQIAGKGR